MKSVSNLLADVARLEGRLSSSRAVLEAAKKRVQTAEAELEFAEKVLVLVRTVAQQTQQQLEYQVSELATVALASVLPDPYKVQVFFEIKRGRSEAAIQFQRRGKSIDPISAAGGGTGDLAAFALRASLRALHHDLRPILILDEPFKFLHGRSQQEKSCEIVEQIAKVEGTQVIVISQEEDGLSEVADKVYKVEQSKGISNAREQRPES